MVNVPPVMSWGVREPLRARPASALTSALIDFNPRQHADRTMGTINPRSVCTATEISAFLYLRILSPNQLAFTSGTASNALALALTMKSFTLIFAPSAALSSASCLFNVSRMPIILSKRTSTVR